MEVKSGYKQTEVGVIPEEWDVVKLDKCMDLLTDFEANGSFEHTANSVRVFDTENFAWYVRATDLENDTPLSNVRYVDQASYRFLKKTALFGNEVLITKRGEIGKVYLFEKKTEHATLAPNLYLLKLNETVWPAYVFAYFKHGNGNRTLKNINASTTLGALYKNDVKAIILPRPPLPQQRAIATALSDADGLRGGLDRLIAKKRDLKQAAMQQLLTGQTRLPGFHGEWEVKRLGDLVQIQKGQLITSNTLMPGDIPVIAGGKQPAYYHDTSNRLGRTITISASGASAGYIALYNEPIFASDCSTISESKCYCLDFIYYQLLCKQQTIYKAQTGGAQPHIHAKDLTPILFSVPPLPEQTAIAEVLTEMDAELAGLELRREKTHALKQAMMQELLTGRIRFL